MDEKPKERKPRKLVMRSPIPRTGIQLPLRQDQWELIVAAAISAKMDPVLFARDAALAAARARLEGTAEKKVGLE